MKSKTTKAAGKASLDPLFGLLGRVHSVYSVLRPDEGSHPRMPYVVINSNDTVALAHICARLTRLRKQANDKLRGGDQR